MAVLVANALEKRSAEGVRWPDEPRRSLLGAAGILAAVLVAGASAATVPPDRLRPTSPPRSTARSDRPSCARCSPSARATAGRLAASFASGARSTAPCSGRARASTGPPPRWPSVRTRCVCVPSISPAMRAEWPRSPSGSSEAGTRPMTSSGPATPGAIQDGTGTATRRGSTSTARPKPRSRGVRSPAVRSPLLGSNWEVRLLQPNFQQRLDRLQQRPNDLAPRPASTGRNAVLAWRSPIAAEVRLDLSIDVEDRPADCPCAGGERDRLDRAHSGCTHTALRHARVRGRKPRTDGERRSVRRLSTLSSRDNGDANRDSTIVRLSVEHELERTERGSPEGAATLSVRADVAELVDAHGSGPCALRGVEVQVLSSACSKASPQAAPLAFL